MKLRYKETGKVVELLAVAYNESDSIIILMVEIDGRREMLLYKTLAQLYKELEDYYEEAKPALTEEERSYLIAWLKLMSYKKWDGIKRDTGKLVLIANQEPVAAIPTFGRFRWWPDGIAYTIKALEL